MIGHFRESGHPTFRGWNLEEERKEDGQRFTLLRNLRTLDFYFAHFTRQISSVSTEQYRVGVKNKLKRFLAKQLRMWTSLFQERTTSYRKSWIRMKWICWFALPTRTKEAPGNSLHGHLERFRRLQPEDPFRKIYESAGFMRRVSVGMCDTEPFKI